MERSTGVGLLFSRVEVQVAGWRVHGGAIDSMGVYSAVQLRLANYGLLCALPDFQSC